MPLSFNAIFDKLSLINLDSVQNKFGLTLPSSINEVPLVDKPVIIDDFPEPLSDTTRIFTIIEDLIELFEVFF